jgi:hypothetical protein
LIRRGSLGPHSLRSRRSFHAQPAAGGQLTLEIDAEAPSGFKDQDLSLVRDNTKQLKFTPGSTGSSN